MKEIELGQIKPVIKVKKDGKEYLLNKIKLGRLREIQEEIISAGGAGIAKVISLLVAAGLPEEIALELDQDEAILIVESLSEGKKKA